MRERLTIFTILPGALLALAAVLPALGQSAATTNIHLATFDKVWQLVDETHFDPEFNGTDWNAVRAELRPLAEQAGSAAELRAILDDMLSRLGQSHFSIYSAGTTNDTSAPEPPLGCPQATYSSFLASLRGAPSGAADPGLRIRALGDELVVTRVRPESDAAEEGITPGWRVTEVAGVDLRNAPGCVDAQRGGDDPGWLFHDWMNHLLQGPDDSRLAVGVIDVNGRSRSLKLRRSMPRGPLAGFGNLGPLPAGVEFDWISTPERGLRIARIGFDIWLLPVVEAFQERMIELREADGLILDLRGNPGGMAVAAQAVAGHFLSVPLSLGSMNSRHDSMQLTVNPRIVTPQGDMVGVIETPIAILLDPFSASTSEVFAAGLQDLGRAALFGEPTAGAALPAMLETLPNGDLFMHATMDFVRPGGEPVEGRPVRPDVLAPPTRHDLAAGRDPALEAALHWIDTDPPVDTSPTL